MRSGSEEKQSELGRRRQRGGESGGEGGAEGRQGWKWVQSQLSGPAVLELACMCWRLREEAARSRLDEADSVEGKG